VLVASLQRLAHLLTPASLLDASLLIAPETGHKRPPENVAFEEAILVMTDASGNWQW
jgi:hypothetical protein